MASMDPHPSSRGARRRRALPRLLWLGALIASTAAAQTAAVGGVDLSRGATLLPGSAAWSDEATSLVFNPAGLGRVGKFNAWYVHELSRTRSHDNDGLWLSSSVGGLVGLGVGFEWLRPGAGLAGPERAKSALGLSVGPQGFSAGATVNWFFGGEAQGLTSLDLGLQSRPLRWLSLGALVRNLNEPKSPSAVLGREWTVGLGLRPLGEQLSLGVDWIAPQRVPLVSSRLQYTLQARVLGGVRLLGGFSHGFSGREPLYFHAGIGVDFEHLGYTQGLALADGQFNWQFAGRISVDEYQSVLPEEKVAVISLADLEGPRGPTLGSLLGLEKEDRYLRLLRFLEEAAADPELKGVVIKVEDAGVGLARADEIRSAISKLRSSGKKVFAYVLSLSDTEYLMVSGCDAIYAAPQAMILVDGLRSSVTFFGGTAKRFGIDVDVARVGDFKTAPEQFTRQDMSEPQRETINAYLDTNVKIVAARIQASRGIGATAWQAALDEGLKPAQRAVQLGHLDGIMTPIQFDEFVSKQIPGARVDRHYRPFENRDERWGRRPSIAIVPVLGSISGGKNETSPLEGESAGAQSFFEALEDAAEDPTVVAIVVRIDSGGGDGLASDLMYRAVLEAKKKKPVIASMGDVAASGGYYVAMGADEIVASPTTLTGSIGVFFAKPAIKRLSEELGTTQVSISRGKLAGITDIFEPWTEAQRAAAQRWIDDFYDSFITEVSSSRKMTKESVDAVARGRVWSGEDAKAKGLVDHLGGLMEAVALAKAKSGAEGELALTLWQRSSSPLSSLLGAAAPDSLLETPAPKIQLPHGLQSLAEQLGRASWLLGAPRIQARIEYSVEIR